MNGASGDNDAPFSLENSLLVEVLVDKRRHESWIYDTKLFSWIRWLDCQRSLVNYPTRFRRYTRHRRWFNKRRAWQSLAISGKSRSSIISISNDCTFFTRNFILLRFGQMDFQRRERRICSIKKRTLMCDLPS